MRELAAPQSPAGGPNAPPSDPTASPAPGNRVARSRVARGAVAAVLGGAWVLTLMARPGHWSLSVPLGFMGCLVVAWGMLEAVGSFDDLQGEAANAVRLRDLLFRLLESVGSVVALLLALRLAVSGILPWPRLGAAVLVTACFLGVVIAAYRAAATLGVWTDRSAKLAQRHGFWLVAVTTLVYLPMLGSYSLTDPWETHYGEVAREMLARDDWISLWWAQDGWFFSKPILDFWIQGLAFALLGVRFMPDEMISSTARNLFPQPEWAARLPVFLMALGGAYILYRGAAAAFGRRPAFLGSIVLLTTPYWAFLSHQSMTDMPYVAPLAAGLGLLLLAFATDPDTLARRYPVQVGSRTYQLSAFHAVFGLVLLLVLAQSLYLLSRNVTFQIDASPRGYLVHRDVFWSGSGGGNCGLPGNAACERYVATWSFFQPWLLALTWTVGVMGLLVVKRHERRLQRLCFLGFWLCLALSFMAKGAPGLVLPLGVVAVYVVAARRWTDVSRMELLTGALLLACVALPWFVQMYIRHGPAFTDRLLLHDMYKRAFVHVHDTNAGDDVTFRYYIWQLGYGLFPWTGLAVAALFWWLRGEGTSSRPCHAAWLLGFWFVLSFAMFTVSLTKFHHYVLPAVPGVALLTGWLLHRMIQSERSSRFGVVSGPWSLVALGLGCVWVIDGVRRCFPGGISGEVVSGTPPQAAPLLGIGLVVMGGVLAAAAGRPGRIRDESREGQHDRADWALMLVAVIAAVIVLPVGRDLWATFDKKLPGAMRLLHLFTYNYDRPWPQSLDFRAVLIGFSVSSAVAFMLLVLPRWRLRAVSCLCIISVLWTAWLLNLYLVRSAPHWGQRETIMAYYNDRSGPDEPLVAFQMNWKGENFYTGNRLPAFVTSGDKFKEWLADQRARGIRTLYFSTEHSRIGSLRRELGDPSDFQVLTTKELNNKFMVARVRFGDDLGASSNGPKTLID